MSELFNQLDEIKTVYNLKDEEVKTLESVKDEIETLNKDYKVGQHLKLMVRPEKISVVKNKWVWILAVMFVIGDKALFIANANPESKITMM